MKVMSVVLALGFFCLPATAQNYGTQSETAYTIMMQEFVVGLPSNTWGTSNSLRFITNNFGCCFEAPVLLPSGAQVTAVQVEGCDSSSIGALAGVLFRCASPGGGCTTEGPTASSPVSGFPGCAAFRADFSPPLTIVNSQNTYYFRFENVGDVTGAVALRAARVYYKLQVSPAPPTPTFTDVPTTHPFYQFIEALAASGITAGCSASPPQYCPDATLTRGQMAVFLSRALGLHFTP